jgi:hypothetical protein
MHLLAERFVFFEGDDRGFLKEVFKTNLMAPMSPRIVYATAKCRCIRKKVKRYDDIYKHAAGSRSINPQGSGNADS